MKKVFKNRRAFTMIELILSIGIILIVSALGLFAYNKISNEHKLKSTTEFLNLSSIVIQNNFNEYQDISLENLKSLDLIDNQQQIENGVMKNKFGGEIELIEYEKGKGFNFRMTNIPMESCVNLLQNTQAYYSFANDEVIIPNDIIGYSKICQDEELNLTYKNNFWVKSVSMDEELKGVSFNIYGQEKDAIGKQNRTDIAFENGHISVLSKNGTENDLNEYLHNSSNFKDQVDGWTEYLSTGYKTGSCGQASNSSNGCNDLNTQDLVNKLLNAPEEYFSDPDTKVLLSLQERNTGPYADKLSDETVNNICKQFTCTKYGDNTLQLNYKK